MCRSTNKYADLVDGQEGGTMRGRGGVKSHGVERETPACHEEDKRSECRTLSSSSTMSACMLPCPTTMIMDWTFELLQSSTQSPKPPPEKRYGSSLIREVEMYSIQQEPESVELARGAHPQTESLITLTVRCLQGHTVKTQF
ncbi:hypothetical protein STEG23_003039 [Scotinomys teguina]